MPGHQVHTELRPKLNAAVKLARVQSAWLDEHRVAFQRDGWKVFDVRTRQIADAPNGPRSTEREPHPNDHRRRPDRGYQFTETFSDDGRWRAYHEGGNVAVHPTDGSSVTWVTRDGSRERRVRYGTCSWVYGEELGQVEAMGWSPDAGQLWYYKYDETKVPDYYMAMDQTQVQSRLHVEAYPKAGAPNPIPDLYVWRRATGQATLVQVRPGPFDDEVGHYVYGVRWSPDGTALRFFRANRLQNTLEYCSADPASGAVRALFREQNPNGWVESSPWLRHLDEGEQADPARSGDVLWLSEVDGFSNLVITDRAGRTRPVTRHRFDVLSVLAVDPKSGWVHYMAGDGETPYLRQWHRVRLDGTGHQRISDPRLSHSVQVSPTGEHAVVTSQSTNTPPTVRVVSASGEVLATLAESDVSGMGEVGYRPTERFQFLSADGQTVLHGELDFPPNFDPNKRYPVIVQVYGGPDSGGLDERFSVPPREVDFGFLVARFAGRGTTGRGRAFKDAVYRRLGVVEIDDQAAGARHLQSLAYVDPSRIGITGVSYGGYASAMALLRFPEVFASAVASSSVTDWRNYDSIYTERYMSTPQLNPQGYDEGSAMRYASNLTGRLMLFWGSSDDNVHPSNSLQLIQALQRAGRSFEAQVGPDQGHTGLGWRRSMEFFIERMVLNNPRAPGSGQQDD